MSSAGGNRFSPVVVLAGLLVVTAACVGSDDSAESKATTTTAPAPVADPYGGHHSEVYDGTANWLCHPDLAEDECSDLSATEVDEDGTVRPADLHKATDPAIDCFYIYPTESLDPTPNSDLIPDDQEKWVVERQAAPFGTTCRVYAPVYRQVTVPQIFKDDPEPREVAYDSALDAWKTYISQYNDGRGVILIGHSQGMGILSRLIASEIDPNPELRDRLVSAMLMGGAIHAPDGELVGGDFENIPACTSADQVGCVITYSSYRTAMPPGSGSIFARADGADRALCTDPVELAGNEFADAIVPSQPSPFGGDFSAVAPGVTTRYIVLPGILKVSCQRQGDYDFFGVEAASPDDTRQAALEGLLSERLGPTWGLHNLDPELAMGDLLEIAARQATAYTNGD